MKFNDIARVCRSKKWVVIMTDSGGEQWISVGVAAYKLEGLPRMTAEDCLNLIGVAEDKKKGWHRADRTDEQGILKNDRPDEVEVTADMAGMTVEYKGYILTPIYLSDGMVWVDTTLLAPVLRGKLNYLRFFIRYSGDSRILVVKDGLVMIAMIGEVLMKEELYQRVKTLWTQCMMQGIVEEEDADEDSGYDPDYGEGDEDCETEPADAGHGGED